MTNDQKKREPLGQLSRSSGCIYLTYYTMLGMWGNTPQLTLFVLKVLGKISELPANMKLLPNHHQMNARSRDSKSKVEARFF
ncbi:hypothetical protein [Fischerella sp. PCC 9605]|uniref:hypothetical protein n=1 Tax=Fischerella sp. PCC 9605 TaxID=1173024 RepID=UPI0012DFAB7D|nr:hypothetical protein [Fischerella sp. PCC 9605]